MFVPGKLFSEIWSRRYNQKNLAASAELERLRARETELPAEIPTLRSRETEFRSEIIVRKQKTRNCWALKLLLIIPKLLWAKSDVCSERSQPNGNINFFEDWRRSLDPCPRCGNTYSRSIDKLDASRSHQMTTSTFCHFTGIGGRRRRNSNRNWRKCTTRFPVGVVTILIRQITLHLVDQNFFFDSYDMETWLRSAMWS